jgi:hypothetical protein
MAAKQANKQPEQQSGILINRLNVVGYANVFAASMLPTVAPPIFSLRGSIQKVFFFPPYSLNGGLLRGSTAAHQAKLEELNTSGEITLFGHEFAARMNHTLWIDESFCHHYQPTKKAEQELTRIVNGAIKEAKTALCVGDFKRAEHFSGVAMCADDRRVEPIAIKALIRQVQNDEPGARLMVRLVPAERRKIFDRLLKVYSNLYKG